MDAFVATHLPGSEIASRSMHAPATEPSLLQLLPDEVFATITNLLLRPLDKMYTPFGCARTIAALGQTNHHFRVAMQHVWPVRIGATLLVYWYHCALQ